MCVRARGCLYAQAALLRTRIRETAQHESNDSALAIGAERMDASGSGEAQGDTQGDRDEAEGGDDKEAKRNKRAATAGACSGLLVDQREEDLLALALTSSRLADLRVLEEMWTTKRSAP